jgi:hypothetical protein
MENNNPNNINNNVNNINIEVKLEQPSKSANNKNPNWYKKIIITSIATIIISVGTYYGKSSVRYFFREAKDKKIIHVLTEYADGLNENKFDAYSYFPSKVDRFFQMCNTTPKEINTYVNGLYKKQFINVTMYFDESTLTVKQLANGDYNASVMMYSTYFETETQKQHTDFKTRIELKFDTDFKIKYFRQFYN